MWKEFKNFAFQGNLIDMAVAVIFGFAFGEIVNSLVDDIIMPLVGTLMGGIDFSSLAIMVGDASIAYGKFIQTIVNFLIIAGSIFLVLRLILKKDVGVEEEEEVDPQEALLTEIRDLLKDQK